jgi:hypothetical protein
VALGGLIGVVFLSQGLVLFRSFFAGEFVSQAAWISYIKNSTDTDNFYKASALGLAIAFLAWLRRTVENVPPLGGGTPRYSPNWAIGWWFVPVAFLVMPFIVVRDAWRRMATTEHEAGAALVGIWWLSFVGATMLSRYSGAAATPVDFESFQPLYAITLAGAVLGIFAAVSGFLVVREIQGRADARADALGVHELPPRSLATFQDPRAAPPPPPSVARPASAAGSQSTSSGTTSADLTEALRTLDRLREQRLVTEEEYGAKRKEILARL